MNCKESANKTHGRLQINRVEAVDLSVMRDVGDSVNEMLRPIVCIMILAGCSGCASMVDSVIDSTIDMAFETGEQRDVRHDVTRWRQGEPPKHHRSEDHLKAHYESLQFREWEKERYLDELQEQADLQRQIEQMEKEQEMWDRILKMPIDTGLTNSP